jgi:hypothetical protein
MKAYTVEMGHAHLIVEVVVQVIPEQQIYKSLLPIFIMPQD